MHQRLRTGAIVWRDQPQRPNGHGPHPSRPSFESADETLDESESTGRSRLTFDLPLCSF